MNAQMDMPGYHEMWKIRKSYFFIIFWLFLILCMLMEMELEEAAEADNMWIDVKSQNISIKS